MPLAFSTTRTPIGSLPIISGAPASAWRPMSIATMSTTCSPAKQRPSSNAMIGAVFLVSELHGATRRASSAGRSDDSFPRSVSGKALREPEGRRQAHGLPTLAELGGARVRSGLDGRSTARALRGETQPASPFLYWEFHERGFQQAVRMGKWKAARLKTGDPLEVYDLETDPHEEQQRRRGQGRGDRET